MAKHPNGVYVLAFSGKINGADTMDQAMLELDAALNEAQTKGIILDLSELQYVNSSGINGWIKMLTKTRTKGKELFLANLSPAVEKLVAITKLNSIFNICASVEEAQNKLNAQEA